MLKTKLDICPIKGFARGNNMDKADYARRRILLIQRLMSIPSPKFFPRSVRYVLMLIANLDAEYSGDTTEKCYQQLLNEYKKLKSHNDEKQ